MRRGVFIRASITLLVTQFVVGCGAVPTSLPAPVAGMPGRQQVTFRIDVPATASASNERRTLYVSPATTQMSIDIQTGCPGSCVSLSGYPTTMPLTTTSGGCTSTLANTLCQLTVALPPGSYTATLATQDASGNVLSKAQSIGLTVVAGANNTIPLTLSGVPKALVVAAAGGNSHQVIVNALDADNNIIVGPGAPNFTIAPNNAVYNSASVSIAQPTAAAPNAFTATPTSSGTASFTVTANYSGSGVTNACALAGAVCTGGFTIVSSIPVFVANCCMNSKTSITEYAPPYTGPLATIDAGIGQVNSIVVDSAGDVFTANSYTNEVSKYSPPYTGPASIVSFYWYPLGPLLLDTNENLFIASRSQNAITEYAPPYTGSPTTISSSLSQPSMLAFDGLGNLFALNGGSNTITEYAPPYTGTPATIISGVSVPKAMAVDSSGTVFVTNAGGSYNVVDVYKPPYGGSPITISNGISNPFYLAVNSKSALFVYDAASGNVTEYGPGDYTTSPVTLSTPRSAVSALTLDSNDNLYVADSGINGVTVLAPPYTGTGVTISNGVFSPVALAEPKNFYVISVGP
jgi:hypothetical protein